MHTATTILQWQPLSCAPSTCGASAALDVGVALPRAYRGRPRSCDACATQICAADSYCCSTSWDSICVGEVSSVCNQSCGGGTCAHSLCSTGTKLTSSCDSRAATICGQDSYCCTTKWDSQCVSEVSSMCNKSCN